MTFRAAGIDPGSVTGIVVLDVPDHRTIYGARWVAGASFRPSQRSSWPEWERDVNLSDRIADFLTEHGVVMVAIEEAAEAKMLFRGYKHQRSDTAFRAGTYYAVAMIAAHLATYGKPGRELVCYPAVTTKSGRCPGWMGMSKRTTLIPKLRAYAQQVGAPPELGDIGEDGELTLHHQADALGVLAHHLESTRLQHRMGRPA